MCGALYTRQYTIFTYLENINKYSSMSQVLHIYMYSIVDISFELDL